jgi:hypothetical protein
MIKMNNIPLIRFLTQSNKFSWLHLLSLFTTSSIAAITISLSAQAAETILFVASLTLPSPELLDDYTNSLMLAFFEVHLNDNPDYQPYLQSSYAIYLSEGEDFQTDLITKASAESLDQAIEKLTNERNIERIK